MTIHNEPNAAHVRAALETALALFKGLNLDKVEAAQLVPLVNDVKSVAAYLTTVHAQITNTTEAEAAAIFNSANAVDELGLIKAQIAELEQKEKALTDALKAIGLDRFAGTFFDCTISRSERANFDIKALRADLGEEICAPYVKAPTKVVTLKLVAKK